MTGSIHFNPSFRFDQLSWHDRRSIFEFAGHSTTLLSVCKGWAGLLSETLEDFCARETPSPFLNLRKVVTVKKSRNYFAFFRRMNKHLSKQLNKLDPESRREIF